MSSVTFPSCDGASEKNNNENNDKDNNNNNDNNNNDRTRERVVEKEQEKIEHYSDLKRKLKKIWKCSHIEIVPIIVGALGIVSKNLEGWMKKISLKSSTAQLQKATLLGTARILRKILET